MSTPLELNKARGEHGTITIDIVNNGFVVTMPPVATGIMEGLVGALPQMLQGMQEEDEITKLQKGADANFTPIPEPEKPSFNLDCIPNVFCFPHFSDVADFLLQLNL